MNYKTPQIGQEYITELEAEIERLRAALMKICTMQGEPIQIARQALAKQGK